MGAIYDKVLDTGKQFLAYKPVRVTLVLIVYASHTQIKIEALAII